MKNTMLILVVGLCLMWVIASAWVIVSVATVPDTLNSIGHEPARPVQVLPSDLRAER